MLSYTPYSVIYETDSSLAAGKERVAQYGIQGCKSITYKVIKQNGVEIERIVLSSDTYDPQNKIIKRGPTSTSTSTTTTTPSTSTTPETPIETPTTPPETSTTPETSTPSTETPTTPETPSTDNPTTSEGDASTTE